MRPGKNKEIVFYRDRGKTFTEIGWIFSISTQKASEIYTEEVARGASGGKDKTKKKEELNDS